MLDHTQPLAPELHVGVSRAALLQLVNLPLQAGAPRQWLRHLSPHTRTSEPVTSPLFANADGLCAHARACCNARPPGRAGLYPVVAYLGSRFHVDHLIRGLLQDLNLPQHTKAERGTRWSRAFQHLLAPAMHMNG